MNTKGFFDQQNWSKQILWRKSYMNRLFWIKWRNIIAVMHAILPTITRSSRKKTNPSGDQHLFLIRCSTSELGYGRWMTSELVLPNWMAFYQNEWITSKLNGLPNWMVHRKLNGILPKWMAIYQNEWITVKFMARYQTEWFIVNWMAYHFTFFFHFHSYSPRIFWFREVLSKNQSLVHAQ